MDSGKTALVTGGSRGIGYGIATCLARDGWNLLVNGMRSEAEAGASLGALRDLGAEVHYLRGDIGSEEGRAAIIGGVRAVARPALGLLVNNAGMAPRVRLDLLDMTEESYDEVLDTNLRGPVFLTRDLAKDMIRARRDDPAFEAAVVNITSISAAVASVNRSEYCIAKAGLSMMSRLFAVRLGAEGIPVYEVRPGVTRTDMTAAVAGKYDRLIADGLCLDPRWGEPGDVGRAVAALARGDFPYATGQVVTVDGGLTIPRL